MPTKTTKKTVFDTLDTIDVSKYTEKKGNFTYLSWAWAVRELLRVDPSATWNIHEWGMEGNRQPYMQTEAGCFVQVTVTVNEVNRTQVHPVLDHRNQPIKQPNAFEINTSIQRCLAKAIALHGLGLYIYAGEDLPTPPQPLDDNDMKMVDELLAKIDDKQLTKKVVDQIANETINKHNLSGSLAKLERMAS